MGAPVLRAVRRPRGSLERRSSLPALTAASQPVTDPQKAFRTVIGAAGRADWQAEAWEMHDLVGELHYYVSWRAVSCSRVRLIASEIDPVTGLPTGGLAEDDDGNLNTEQKRVAEIFKKIAGGPLGQSQMNKRSAECLTVPGEHWIGILVRDDGEHWLVLTRDEIRAKAGGGAEIEMPDGTKHDYSPSRGDSLFRVWFPRPRRAKEPDSPVRACLDPLREIVRTSKKIKNASKSRLIGNGVLFLPQGMSLPSTRAPVAANQPGLPMPEVTGVPAADQLSNRMYQVAKVAIEDEDSQAAFIPLMATVPDEMVDKVQHIKFGNEITDVEIKTRNDAIARLAMGLDVSPERLLGVGTNSNHWSAWQISDEDVQIHIKPVMETLCAAINNEVLKAILTREGIDPAKYVLWYDAGTLTQDPDKTDEATAAKDHGAMTAVAYRKHLGFADEDGYDLTTLEGAQEWARDAVTQDPTLLGDPAMQMLLGGELETIDWPTPPPALPPGEQPPADEQQPIEQEPQTEKTGQGDSAARVATPAELILAERLLVGRALELANRRRVNTTDRQQKERLRGIAVRDYHRYMPPVAEAEIPKLINGWDSALGDEVIAMLGVDTDTLRATVRRQVYLELTRPVIDGEVG